MAQPASACEVAAVRAESAALPTDQAHASPDLREAGIDPAALRYCRATGRAISVISMAAGLLVLLGWVCHRTALESMFRGWAAMKPNTALSFIFAGVALWLALASPSRSAKRQRVQATVRGVCAAIVFLIGLASLVECAFDLNLGIDRMFPREWLLDADGAPVGRMPPVAALGFVLLGSSLFFLHGRNRPARLLSIGMALATLLTGLTAVLGYLYGAEALYHISGFASMALNTALLFVALGVGALSACPAEGIVAEVNSSHSGGMIARRLLPVAFVLPATLGWLRMFGEQRGWYGPEFGQAMLAVANILGFTGLIWLASRTLNAFDRQRVLSDRELRASDERFRLLVDNIRDYAVFMLDRDGRVLTWNSCAQSLTGFTAAEAIGRPFTHFNPNDEEGRRLAAASLAAAAETGRQVVEGWCARKDGTRFWASSVIDAIRNEQNQLIGFAKVMHDLTERLKADAELGAALDHLNDANQRINLLNTDLERRIAQRTKELESANRELERRQREIENFYHTLAHELKTPLTAAREFISILRDGLAGPMTGTQSEYLGIAGESCDQLRICIDDLFDSTRLETGKLRLERKPVALGSVAVRVLQTMRPLAERKQISLVHEIAAELPPVPVDEGRITQVLTNLINNSLKFTPAGGTITVRVELDISDPQYLLVSVTDTGCGIAPGEFERIFDRLYQIKSGDAATGNGIGLGLYISKELVELHGGRMRVHSQPGHGSTFSFAIPIEDSRRHGLVLILDEDRASGEFTAGVLRSEGYQVTTACDSSAALIEIAARKPEVVVLDLNMQDMDGLFLLQEIRQKWGPVPVVFHTSHADADRMSQAFQFAPFTVLTKPCSPRQLLATIRGARRRFDTSFESKHNAKTLPVSP